MTLIILAAIRRRYLAGRLWDGCTCIPKFSKAPTSPKLKIGMHKNNGNDPKTLGFVTVRYHEQHGYFGGYLIVNERARPLEFHCTLPIQPTRAQQILYGKTLNEFVCGEQIARALVTKAKTAPTVLLSDTLAVLTLRHMHPVPIGFVETTDATTNAANRPSSERSEYRRFKALGLKMAVLPEYADDCDVFANLFTEDRPPLDLLEPFGRIEEALHEAHPSTKAA